MRSNEILAKRFKFVSSEKGVSLLEAILAMAIISILSVSFFQLFLNGYKAIALSGLKSSAQSNASTILERLYTLSNVQSMTDEELKTALSDTELSVTIVEWKASNIYTYTGENIKFCRSNMTLAGSGDGTSYILVVFYKDGTKHISITGFKKGG